MTKPSIFRKMMTRIMRVFFYLLYHPMAGLYDFVAKIVSLGHWNKWVYSVLPELKGPQVLELGFGPGHLQAKLLEKNIQAFGIDPSPQMARQAQSRLLATQVHHQLTIGYAQYIPFSNHSFDQIVATFPTGYIFETQTLKNIQRVLKTDGKLIVLLAARLIPTGGPQKIVGWLFKVTGQAPKWDTSLLEPFQKAGYQTRMKLITHRSWEALVIMAKPQ
jgi:ubiquinone/menaquinone biosynthesis C-methylase UbiE